MFPDLGAYKNFYAKSLEEFNIEDGTGLKEIYYELKSLKPDIGFLWMKHIQSFIDVFQRDL